MLWLQLLCGLLLLNGVWNKPAAQKEDDDEEDCEINAPDTMHDFCCDLHDELSQFVECQIEWHEKIHYTTDKEEQTYMFCTAECTFNGTELLKPNRKSLNLKRVQAHLESELADDADEALLYETYVKCDKHATSLLSHKSVKSLSKRLDAYGCHPYPGLVMECVSNDMILNCPPKRFHDTAQCRVARDYLRNCMTHVKYKP
ncbi:uncharacterized protein LOC115634686 [Scaptodrosophila lebanonensis]|uniref:Uncharacterized protein LOC115634686 n=1 Tax=Drosophila lebanonensis TaxID=7225 RepID=A0A6J2UJK3_DROLE|nr:uncharacterized protein LOC115634686 [Scaptodrosophila lebanonensis]